MIERRGERGSGTSMLAARHDDDDMYIYKNTYGFGKNLPSLIVRMILTGEGSDQTTFY